MIVMTPQYSTQLFNEIYSSVDSFMDDYGALGLPKTITDDNAEILYYLMLSRYGNSPIANLEENQFKTKLQAVIWQFGPTWEKRLDIQSKLRALTENDILAGTSVRNISSGTSESASTNNGSAIKNHATNPGDVDYQKSVESWPALTYIDQQNTDKMTGSGTVSNEDSRTSNQVITKSKMDAYMQLWEVLDNDVTNEFLAKFQKLFKQFVRPEHTLLYGTPVEWD